MSTDDNLTLTIRLHDPKEKTDPRKAAQWAVTKIPREDLKLSPRDFAAKHVLPALEQLTLLGNKN